LSLLKAAEKQKVFKEVSKNFSMATWPDSIKRTVGQPTDYHLNVKALSQNILDSHVLSWKVKKVFENAIKRMDDEIERYLREVKERFEAWIFLFCMNLCINTNELLNSYNRSFSISRGSVSLSVLLPGNYHPDIFSLQ